MKLPGRTPDQRAAPAPRKHRLRESGARVRQPTASRSGTGHSPRDSEDELTSAKPNSHDRTHGTREAFSGHHDRQKDISHDDNI